MLLRARPEKHFKAVTDTAGGVAVSHQTPEGVLIHTDTTSTLQATSARAGVKRTAPSKVGEDGHWEVVP